MIKNIISRIPFNIKLTLITFFSFIAIFNIWRLIFFYFYIDDFNSEISLYIKSFYVGYRLDAVLAAILTLPVFLISHFPKITFNRYTRFAYFCYVVLLFIVISFLNIIDIEFFKEFGSHLNMQAQMYGFESGDEAWIQIWVAYPVFSYLFIIFFISYFLYRINNLLVKFIKSNDSNYRVITRSIISLFVFLFLAVSARGGLQERPVTPGYAYFNRIDDMANHLAINSVHNYIHSLIQNSKEPSINYYENADKITNQILKVNRNINKGLLSKFNSPNKPNVILILLESHTGQRCNYLNPNLNDIITPVLDSIATEGINFKNCYANGPRTAHGLSSTLCSWPTIPGYPLIRQPQYKIKGQSTFASIFKNMGYSTGFLYGGNSEFDEMKSFAIMNAFDNIYDHVEDSYLSTFPLDNENGGSNPWGVFDEILFNKCLSIMNAKDSNEPKMLTILTATNHAPWIIPNKYEDKIPKFNSNFKGPFSDSRRTMRYVDFALGEFIDKAKNQDWFDNTIFIITADHGLNIFKYKINDPRNGHIPFLIYNSNLEPLTIDKLVSHVDILPTILDLIGHYESYDEDLFGCSGFRGDKGFVFRNNDYNIQYIENGWVYSETIGVDFMDNYPLDKNNTNQSPNIDSLQKKCRAYAQSSFYGQKQMIKKGSK